VAAIFRFDSVPAMSKPLPDDLPIVEFASVEEFDAWLERNHADAPGVWARMAKVKSGIPSMRWEEAVPIALRWGWIDGQRRGQDETYFLQRWTPRRKRSVWSKVNVAHCERLIAEGRMTSAGMAQVEAAKADGRWEAAYESGTDMQTPPELQVLLDADPKAAAAFDKLNQQNRYAMCWRVHTAKQAETKQRRAQQFVEMLRRGETLY
jgi:uncharacterized protein YdeI (YjbR/CyaY-like superfamily)